MKKIKVIIVKYFVSIFGYLYKNIEYKNTDTLVKVNLGCGLQCLPGWINVDGSLTALLGSKKFIIINKLLYRLAGSSDYYSFQAYNKIIQESGLKFYNLQKAVPLKSESSDIIYCSHFLEHLSKKDGKYFLQECHRTLKSGGLLRLAMPDLDIAMIMYQNGEVERMEDLFYYTSPDWDMAAHKYNYNFNYLKETLLSIGFKDVKKMTYKNGECPNIDYLDVYPDHSLYVECKK